MDVSYNLQRLEAMATNLNRNLRLSATTVSLAWAVGAVGLLLLWQFLTVHYNREGNWTALFCTGQLRVMPPELEAGTYRFPHSDGYDGQMYRYVAHDPFLRRRYAQYLDGTMPRYSRILVPGFAFIAAAGHQNLIDRAYVAVVAMFVLLGAYWLAQLASIEGFHPACGLAFLLVPATLVSMDRMTVDVALTALAVGFAWYSKTKSWVKLYLVLVLACLVRETGILLVAACCIVDLLAKRFKSCVIWASTCLPLAGWYLFLRNNAEVAGSAAVPRWTYSRLGLGIIGRLLHPIHYPFNGPMELLVQSLDVVALTGIVCAIAAAIMLPRLRSWGPVSVAAFLYAVMAIALLSVHYWDSCYSYARVFSPMLVFIALETAGSKHRMSGWWWTLVPTALVDLRIGLQLGPQTLGILRGLSGH